MLADSQNPDDSVGEISVQIDLSTDSSTGEHKVTVKGKCAARSLYLQTDGIIIVVRLESAQWSPRTPSSGWLRRACSGHLSRSTWLGRTCRIENGSWRPRPSRTTGRPSTTRRSSCKSTDFQCGFVLTKMFEIFSLHSEMNNQKFIYIFLHLYIFRERIHRLIQFLLFVSILWFRWF